MYFIMSGFIGIGFSVMGNMKPNITMQQRPYRLVVNQRGQQSIMDHYVINK